MGRMSSTDVLQVLNSRQSQSSRFASAQNTLYFHLLDRGIKTSRPMPDKEGRFLCPIRCDGTQWSLVEENEGQDGKGQSEGKQYMVRLFTYVPGTIFYDVPSTPALFHEIGEFLADLQIAMEDYDDPVFRIRRNIWSLEYLDVIERYVFVLKEDWQVETVRDVLDAFERSKPEMMQLEQGMMHGDVNDQNILLRKGEDGEYHVDAVLDLGDTQHSVYLLDLAVAITHLMIECKCMDPLETGGHVLAGYARKKKMFPEEQWGLIRLGIAELFSLKVRALIAGRLSQVLVIGAYTHHLHPSNTYVLTWAARGWELLRRFWHECPVERLAQLWKNVLKSYEERQTDAGSGSS
ncbi:unnamed protein product [Darwinula stevensoni]|uniref:Hydroxylysine kinase n=1 Tax=Darwinula stevensoni TaxID=69355 RepID=A0A7R9A2R9_9CRUS|nr:unnamed protein product [Darwinula stevensoni]CAG0889225.1 unnamed protein product [Darwinula stevensoni]